MIAERWGASVRDLANSIGDAGTACVGRMPTQVQLLVVQGTTSVKTRVLIAEIINKNKGQILFV